MTQLNIVLAKDSTGKLKAAATQRAAQVFNNAFIGMQKQFEGHAVTQEIDGGVSASNISNTLLGNSGPQNLTGFIGFKESDGTPVDAIRKILYGANKRSQGGPTLGPGQKLSGNVPKWTFRVDGPSADAIYNKTPLPWGQGNISWAEGIEKGIPGFAQFLDQYMESDRSRSGGGIQIHKGEVRPGASYRPPENGYLTPILSSFIAQIKAYTRGGLKQQFGSPGGGFLSQQGPLGPKGTVVRDPNLS